MFSPAAFCQSESLLSSQELGLLQEYLLALTTEDHLLRCAAQVPSPLSPKSWTVGHLPLMNGTISLARMGVGKKTGKRELVA